MTDYEIALFLHIVGVAGMFAGIGTSMAALHFARIAPNLGAIRALMAPGALAGKSIPIFSLLVLVTGAYLVEDVWDWDRPWIYLSLAAFLVLFAMGPLINARKIKAIGMEAGRAEGDAIPDGLRAKLDDPVLSTSETTMTLATVGIIYLMTRKPDFGESAVALAAFVLAGLVLSAMARRTRQTSG